MHPAPSTARELRPPRFGRALLAVTLLGLVLRFTRLGSQSFWIDEAISFAWIPEIDNRGLRSLVHNIHGPLQAFCIWLVAQVSTSEAWMRAPSAVAGTLAVPALGLVGRALFGSRIGLAAAALGCVSPFALYYAQECRNYAFTLLFSSCMTAAAWAYARRPGAARGAALVAALLLAIASNLNALFFILGLGAWGLVALRARRRALLGWIGVHAVVGALLVPYAVQITRQVRPERLVGVETGFGEEERLRGETTLHPLALPYTAYAFAAGYGLGPTLEELRADPGAAVRPRHLPALVLVALGFGPPLVFGVAALARGSAGALLLAPAATTLLLTVWLAAANMKPYNVRYLSVLWPAFLLAAALGLARLPRRARLVCGAAALAVCLWSCWNYLFVPRYGRDDVRGAVRLVAAESHPEDVVLQISLTGTLRHYYTDLGARPIHPPAGAFGSPEAASRYLDGVLGAAPVAWYLECREPAIDPAGNLRKALGARAASERTTAFVGVKVHRYMLPTAP